MKTNTELGTLITALKEHAAKNKTALWKRVAIDLEKPTRKRRIVNVFKINQYSKENETIIVPGKVLGVGELNKKVSVAAFNFSDEAYRKIKEKGEALTIAQLMTKNPSGKGVRVLG